MALFLVPKKPPIKINGKVQKIHKINNEIISKALAAADDFSITNIILTI